MTFTVLIWLKASSCHSVCQISQQLLAGSRVNDADKHRQTALHMAAANNTASIISVLLENGIDPDALDEKGNNGTAHTSLLIQKIRKYA